MRGCHTHTRDLERYRKMAKDREKASDRKVRDIGGEKRKRDREDK